MHTVLEDKGLGDGGEHCDEDDGGQIDEEDEGHDVEEEDNRGAGNAFGSETSFFGLLHHTLRWHQAHG